jgi:hypothetical protein
MIPKLMNGLCIMKQIKLILIKTGVFIKTQDEREGLSFRIEYEK